MNDVLIMQVFYSGDQLESNLTNGDGTKLPIAFIK